jgi:hypothetical protein
VLNAKRFKEFYKKTASRYIQKTSSPLQGTATLKWGLSFLYGVFFIFEMDENFNHSYSTVNQKQNSTNLICHIPQHTPPTVVKNH